MHCWWETICANAIYIKTMAFVCDSNPIVGSRMLWLVNLCQVVNEMMNPNLSISLVAAATVRSAFEPFVEIVKSLNLPEWLVHWGHPGNMVLFYTIHSSSLITMFMLLYLWSHVQDFTNNVFEKPVRAISWFRRWTCSCFIYEQSSIIVCDGFGFLSPVFLLGSGSFCYGWLWNIPRLPDSLFRWHCKTI